MTIANTNVSSSYNCNGVTREFNIGFHYNSTLSGLSIVVLHADGTSTTVSANYEIEDNVLTYPTLESELDPLPEGDVITISRVTPLTQSINLIQQGPLDAEVLESGYDKSTLQIQEVASKKQDKLIAGENIIIDEDGTISATGEVVEGVNWGNIHGTLSNQTDLLTALNAKADGADLSTVATSGSYTDLINQPSIPTDTEDLTNGAGYQTASEVNNSIDNAISTKANTDLSNVTKPYVTETYVNGTSWYRVWSDGWCEQGGVVSGVSPTVTLLKTYKNIDYSILCLQQGTSGDYNANLRAQAFDTNSFTVFQSGGGSLFWQTWGYIS